LDECRNEVVIISLIHRKTIRRSTKSIAINSPRDIGLSAAGLCRARKARRHGRKRANLDSVQTPGSNASRTSVRPHRRPAPVHRVGRWSAGKNRENSGRSIRGVELSGIGRGCRTVGQLKTR